MKSQKRFFSSIYKGGGGYAYTITRVKVRKSLLLGKDEFQKLMKMSLPEIAAYLGRGVYKTEVENLGLKFGGVNLIEYALNRNLERTFQEIIRFSISEARIQTKIYLRRYDVQNIKTIIRGKNSNASDEKIINDIIACGELPREYLEEIVKKSSSVNDVIEFFKETEFYDILRKYSGNPAQMEDELDVFFYVKTLKEAEKELREFIRLEILVKNTLNKLRGEKASIKVRLLPHEKIKKIGVNFKEDNTESRTFLKKMLVQRGLKMSGEFKRNIRPILGYFIAKENEINNVRIIARGKHSGLPEDLIFRQLVI